MRKLLYLLLILAVGQVALHGQMAYVNSASGADSSGKASTSLATGSFSATAGNFIVVGVRQGTDTTLPSSVTDSAGNTYTHCAGADSSWNASNLLSVWYASGIQGSATNVVTATWPAGHAYTSIIARQYSGVISADATGAGSGGGTTLSAAITVALSKGGLIVAFGSATSTTNTFSVGTIGGTTATNLIGDGAAGSQITASEDRIATMHTAITASMKQPAGSSWELSVVSFVAGSSGGGGGGGTTGSGVAAAGTITVSNARSASHNFTTVLPSGSVCQVSPAFDPISLPSLTWWGSNTTTSVTVNLNAPGSGTFNFICTAPSN